MASTVLPNGIIIPEKYSRDWYNDLYHNWQELDNLLGGGTPKDGTLTIQKNGTTVGTFSANQATDETVNISVPTATSELTNDSGFITEDNTKIPLAGSNQISGDLIPATDNSIDVGSSNKKIKSVFANYLNSIDLSALFVITNVGYIADLNDSSLRVAGKVIVCSYGRATSNNPTPQASGTCFTLANQDSSLFGIQIALSNKGIYARRIDNGQYTEWGTIFS